MKTNYEGDDLPLTKDEIIEEIMDLSMKMIRWLRIDNKLEVEKCKILIDNLVKIYMIIK